MNNMGLIMENWRSHAVPPPHSWEELMALEIVRIHELNSRMDSELLMEFDLGDLGHLGLDALGLVPGWGEVADIANAAWYAGEGEFLMAALSVVAMVPVVGDIIGKGGKVATYMSKAGSKGATKATQHIAKQLQKHMPKITEFMTKLKSNPKIAEHVDSMVHALKDYVTTALKNSDYAETAQGIKDLGKVIATKPVQKADPSKLGKLKDVAKKVHGAGSHRRKMELTVQNLTGASEEEVATMSDEELDERIPDNMTDDQLAAALGL